MKLKCLHVIACFKVLAHQHYELNFKKNSTFLENFKKHKFFFDCEHFLNIVFPLKSYSFCKIRLNYKISISQRRRNGGTVFSSLSKNA